MLQAPLTITTIPLPANSGHVLLVDSTRRLIESCSTSSSAQLPGSYRHSWTGARLTGTITPSAQSVTVTYEILSNSAGTLASAFETDVNGPGGGTQTVASGATQPYSWLPSTPDFRIRVTAGGTAPTTLKATCELVPGRTSGV